MSNTLSQNMEIPHRSNEEFSKNYKRANQDGIYGPVAVGNINKFDGPGGPRMIINLCMKTIRSGERNASYSQPADWRLKVSTGEHVNVLVENGYVRKLMPIVTKSLTSTVARGIELAEAEDEALATGKEITAQAQSGTPVLEKS